ncbi:MAG: ATP-binding cassette domain-containing protein [Gemmatimonadales bacterium]
MTAPALTLTHITKQFGPVTALSAVDFALQRGEIHALLGENGAGKSTLLQVAYGLVPPDAGVIAVRGQPVKLRSPRDARGLGIGMVHQHFTSIPELTVAENIALAVGKQAAGRLGGWASGRLGGWTAGRLGWDTEGILHGLEPDARVRDLSVAQRQRLEIVKALATGAEILLLDEPSAVLTPDEVEVLLEEIRIFAARGGAVALVTHKLREVFAVAHRVTVLRQGILTLQGPVRDQSEAALAEAMIGTAMTPGAETPSRRASWSSHQGPLVSI